MTLPTYDKFIGPLLQILAASPDGMPAPEVHELAATILGLAEAQRQERLPSGVQEEDGRAPSDRIKDEARAFP